VSETSETLPARSDALVVFGFTGDLPKKIVAAVYAMIKGGALLARARRE
jgi:hypothetical protein